MAATGDRPQLARITGKMMCLMLVGIDGAAERIFDCFDMPLWSSIKSAGKVIPIREDLLRHGLAEMFSGQVATEHGSF
jgi:hypothetical protein